MPSSYAKRTGGLLGHPSKWRGWLTTRGRWPGGTGPGRHVAYLRAFRLLREWLGAVTAISVTGDLLAVAVSGRHGSPVVNFSPASSVLAAGGRDADTACPVDSPASDPCRRRGCGRPVGGSGLVARRS